MSNSSHPAHTTRASNDLLKHALGNTTAFENIKAKGLKMSGRENALGGGTQSNTTRGRCEVEDRVIATRSQLVPVSLLGF